MLFLMTMKLRFYPLSLSFLTSLLVTGGTEFFLQGERASPNFAIFGNDGFFICQKLFFCVFYSFFLNVKQ